MATGLTLTTIVGSTRAFSMITKNRVAGTFFFLTAISTPANGQMMSTQVNFFPIKTLNLSAGVGPGSNLGPHKFPTNFPQICPQIPPQIHLKFPTNKNFG